MPSARFVIAETAATRSPAWRARITSGTVDIPTASAPSVRNVRISAGVSKRRAGGGQVDALGELDLQRARGVVQPGAQLRVVGVAQAREARADRVVVGAGERVDAEQVDVVGDRHQAARGRPRRRSDAGRVGDQQRVGAELLERADRDAHRARVAALVDVLAALEDRDRAGR